MNGSTDIAWAAEQIRLSFFFAVNPPDPTPLWSKITQSAPESVTEKPANGLKVAEGNFGSGRFVIQQSPLRADFMYSSKPFDPNTSEDNPFVKIGPLDEAINLFRKVIEVANSIDLDCVRVAYAPAALVIGSGNPESNRVFKRLNPHFEIDEDVDSDLNLQINKPKPSKTTNSVTINRIFKWQVAEMSLMTVDPNTGTFVQASSKSMCRLELDLSTSIPTSRMYNGGIRLEIINEMEADAISVFSAR